MTTVVLSDRGLLSCFLRTGPATWLPVHCLAGRRAPFSPRGRRGRCEATTDEGGRAQRDGFAKSRSIRHCLADPRHSQLRRRNHKFVRQPENPKALVVQPDVTGFVGKLLLENIVTWPINLDNQSML